MTDSTHVRPGEIAASWWRQYCHPHDGDPVVRAHLRRCDSSAEAMLVPAALDLARRLGVVGRNVSESDARLEAALNLARVLSLVKADVGPAPMRAAGWATFPGDRRMSDTGSEQPTLSEARFQRLLRTSSGEAQVSAFSRLLALLGGEVNVTVLARDFLSWNDRDGRTKRNWAFDYYAAGVAAPPDPLPDEDANL